MLLFFLVVGAFGGLVEAYEFFSERNYKDPDEVFAVVVVVAIYIAVFLWFFLYFEPKYM